MTNPLKEDDIDRFLRQVMRTSSEHPAITNLATRAMERAKNQQRNNFAVESARLARYSVIHQVLSILTAAGVLVFALFAWDHLFLTGVSETTDTLFPAADSVFESLDFLQMLQLEQTSLSALGMILVLAVFLVVHSVLSREPYASG
jgi:hypothetical protein